MPRLYCELHGQEREQACAVEQEQTNRKGESVLVTKGTLRGGPWQCDRCCTTMERGDRAYLFHPFTPHESEHMERYDFAFEQEYFSAKWCSIKLYGRQWPGTDKTGRIAMPARIGDEAGAARSKPLCALDLLTTEAKEYATTVTQSLTQTG